MVSDAIPARDGSVRLGTANGLYRFASPFQVEYGPFENGIVVYRPFSFARVGPRIYAGLQQRIPGASEDRQRWETVTRFEGGGLVSGLLGAGRRYAVRNFHSGWRGSITHWIPTGHCAHQSYSDLDLHASMRLASTPNGETWMGGWRAGSSAALPRSTLQLANSCSTDNAKRQFLAIKYQESTARNFGPATPAGWFCATNRASGANLPARTGLR